MAKIKVLKLLVLAPIITGVLLAFQNCSPVSFSSLDSQSSLDLLGGCSENPSLPECVGPRPEPPVKCTFNGQEYSEGDTVTAFFSSSVPLGETCKSEVRRCVQGTFTGSYLFATCAVNAPLACIFNGVTVPHGDSIEAFQNSSVPSSASCVSEMRTCNNGVLSGSYEHLTCAPAAINYAWSTASYGSCSASPSYSYGSWSACGSNGQQTRSASCVNTSGTQSRTVVCKDQNGTTVSDSLCGSQTRPAASTSCSASCSGTAVTSQACNAPATYAWSASSYGSCSASPSYSYGAWSACGSNGQQTRSASCVNTSGTQSRTVVCKDQNGTTVSDSLCGSQTRPAASTSCSASCSGAAVTSQACTPNYTYSWDGSSIVNSGSCSAVACGTTGTQNRIYTVCRRSDGITVNGSYCGSNAAPAVSCSAPACAAVTCAGGNASANSTANNVGAVNTCSFSWPTVTYNPSNSYHSFTGTSGGTLTGTCTASGAWANVTSYCPAPANVVDQPRRYITCRDIGGDLSDRQDALVYSYIPGTEPYFVAGDNPHYIYYKPGSLQIYYSSCFSGG